MMQKTKNNLRYINMKSIIKLVLLFALTITAQAQEKVKIDGVATVIGENIVLNSDIDKFKKELEQRTENKIKISDCEILEEVMTQKLIAHHAVIDSIKVTENEVNEQVQRTMSYFTQKLGSVERVLEFYGFNDEEDLREELSSIQKEQLLIQKERAKITEKVTVTPEEVKNYFKSLETEGNLPEFSTEVELAQIVKILEPSEEEENRVISKLTQLKKEIENGYSFRLKALINSEDPAVSTNGPGEGGKYTLTKQSGFIKEFKEVAFSLEEGEISDPFKSGFGYHIIQVEKIKGQERDVRHILISPKVTQAEAEAAKKELEKVRTQILNKEITFEEAVKKYSEDKETRNNRGLIINTETNDTRFQLTLMDPKLYGRISNLKQGEITEPFYEEVRAGDKMFKIILLKTKDETHTANFTRDYEKIQNLTLKKKREEVIDKWVKEKIKETYIKINDEFKKCKFKNNWKLN